MKRASHITRQELLNLNMPDSLIKSLTPVKRRPLAYDMVDVITLLINQLASDELTLEQLRKQELTLKNSLLELDLKQKENSLVELDLVINYLSDTITRIRHQLLRIPESHSRELASITDDDEMRSKLMCLIIDSLSQLSTDLLKERIDERQA